MSRPDLMASRISAAPNAASNSSRLRGITGSYRIASLIAVHQFSSALVRGQKVGIIGNWRFWNFRVHLDGKRPQVASGRRQSPFFNPRVGDKPSTWVRKRYGIAPERYQVWNR